MKFFQRLRQARLILKPERVRDNMSVAERERTGLLGIVVAAGLTATIAYYNFQSTWALVAGLLVGAAAASARWMGRWAASRDRFGIGFAVLVALAAMLVIVLLRELHFGANAVATMARVEEYFPSLRGLGKARVVFQVDGRPVSANLRTQSVEIGHEIPILYLRDDPSHVELDSIWDRYLSAGALLLLLGGSVAWEVGLFFRPRTPRIETVPSAREANP
jgi:hypothetical protein